jgi:hypothetical protein
MSLVIDAETGVRDMVFTSVHALLEIRVKFQDYDRTKPSNLDSPT